MPETVAYDAYDIEQGEVVTRVHLPMGEVPEEISGIKWFKVA